MPKLQDMTGQHIGRWKVICRGPNNGNRVQWWCLCSCGERRLVDGTLLRRGQSNSCGCLRDELSRERCGPKNAMFGKTGEDHPTYIKDRNTLKTTVNKQIRRSSKSTEWRLSVFERDSYTCQEPRCGAHGVYLEAHHLFSFSEWEELRFDIDNGVTLCKECHDKYKKKGTYIHRR